MHPLPLIPAKAGTQIQLRTRDIWNRSQPYDLGPGLRRDERVGGSVRILELGF
jgi:hypothetical protein